jgi:hypothetical protein
LNSGVILGSFLLLLFTAFPPVIAIICLALGAFFTYR